jgi:tRNA U34 2-thiouridine synthase MnmA/TrmU
MSVNISHGMSSTSSNWESIDRNSLIVSLTRPQRAITPGQYSVFYLGDECLGSSRITKVGPSLFAMNKNNCRDNLNKKLP